MAASALQAASRLEPPLRHRWLGQGSALLLTLQEGQPIGGPFKPVAIHRYVDLLADSGIDTFIINANACRAWYPSKVIPTILDGYRRGDREYFRGHAICQGATEPEDVELFIDRIMAFMNLYQDLLDAGVIFGTGFAPFRGGPIQYIRETGAAVLLEKLKALQAKYVLYFVLYVALAITLVWGS